ncbi:MAG: ATP synthase F1 subunit epsilon [Rickettsiales bacterium]|nr:ATP synthase F1 subunit epsilon [Pseudomonadota bacterium]MDA0965801.1 ATP synthase F1 subunit epsilon [Pseudomonadota bacterium]MDG4543737.1 ATP synthase F1 subunit epsilon [Rickettsiales bacterium]MDG4545884.1 ATP synthase F1 subunit epsilon [Rickettsiales bacterium]MDG4548130.1 ATP synthase F1 subunit epsilon [Rickettsiales bacterium]
MSKINVELVTPEKLVLSKDVDMVVIPGSDGDFGVLANHSPVISSIRPGVVQLEEGSDKQKIFISGGFAEVTGERCTILATESEDVTNTDASEIENMINAAIAFKQEK